MAIYFYSCEKPYGGFSNFSKHSFELDGKLWQTSEHYFQAQKFINTVHLDEVHQANTPRKAAQIGRDRSLPLRSDWEEVKEDVMMKALEAKFRTHQDLYNVLVETGQSEIIEDSPIDYYWGVGKDRSGKNRLGVLLMVLRDKFIKEI